MSNALERFRNRVPRLKPVPLPVLVPSLSVDIALRSLIPPKAVAKVLLELYLNTFEKLHRILHVPVFLHQMEYFWKAPHSGDLNWTATLIVVLRLGLLLRSQCPDPSMTYGSPEWINRMETQSLQLVELYLHTTTYSSKPSLESLQTQCLVVVARLTDGSKPHIPWKLLGGLLQTGILMGLHHDPSLFPDTVSLYDAEMRRRLWTTILELYVHVSRTSSLPFPVSGTQYNTLRPLNVSDMSFIPCAKELPEPERSTTITDASFQHVLSGTLALRSQLEAITVPNAMDGTLLQGEHCIACQMRKALRPVDSPFELTGIPGVDPSLYSLQRIFLEMVTESSFLHAGLFCFSVPTDHTKELHECCRSILRHHQDAALSLVQRFIVARWFRNDIITAMLLLCLALRAGQDGVREVMVPWKLGM
jgi:hypothetical protein